MTSPSENSLIRKILFSFAATLLFFGVLEVGLRLAGIQPKLHLQNFELPAWLGTLDPLTLRDYKNKLQTQGFVNEDIYAYQGDAELGYKLKPNIQLKARNYASPPHVDKMPLWTIRSNARGFRIGEQKKTQDQEGVSKRTIHVLGDSSSFGWGVEYEEAYASVLQDRLNSALQPGEGEFAVINHSIPGFSSFQGRRLIESRDFVKKEDLVLVSFGANDSLPAQTSDRVRYEVATSFVGTLRRWLEHLLFYRIWQSYLINQRDWSQAEAGPNTPRVSLKSYKENLKTIFTAIKKKGGYPVFVSVCNFYDYPSAALAVSRRNDVPFFDFPKQLKAYLPQVMERFPEQFAAYYDVYGELMEKNESMVFLFPDNCHPNSIGHHLMGEIIFQSIESEPR